MFIGKVEETKLCVKSRGSFNGLTFLANAESHALSLGSDPNEPRNATSVLTSCFLNTEVDKTVFLELALGVEVAD